MKGILAAHASRAGRNQRWWGFLLACLSGLTGVSGDFMGVKETGDESEKLKGKQEMKRIGGDANGSPSSHHARRTAGMM